MTQTRPPEGLDRYWLPFTPNRYFRENPKIVAAAQGAYYTLADGRRVFDCLSGLWCCPLGHGHPRIVEALATQAATLDYAPAFQVSNPATLTLAARLTAMAPPALDRVFFTNSGSEAVDTALKIAIGHFRCRGEGHRTRVIGRERGYHGVGLGGLSIGGIHNNRRMFTPLLLPNVDHLPHTLSLPDMAFSRGEPVWGDHLADDLERLVALHGADTIAAVIVEPVQGSTGVIVPPKGYLRRLRDICTRHGILLIFDEVITGFGRLGTGFAAERFGVTPDMITFAKGVTNGTVPLGGVLVSGSVYDAFMAGPEDVIEFAHGYTYSGHPLAAAVANAVLDVLTDDELFARARALEPILEDAMHALRGRPHVRDIRNIGLAAAVDLEPIADRPGLRGFRVFERGFDHGLLLRVTGDTIAVAPPFIATAAEVQNMASALGDVLTAAATERVE